MSKSTSETIAALESKIRLWNRAYYDLNEPVVSDEEWDAAYNELQQIAPDSSVLNERSQTFDQDYKHEFPMGSLEKCKTIEEVVKRLGKGGKGIITSKLDGASLTIHYNNGRLVRAVTRGRTETGKGKIVTANALMVASIPQTILIQDHIEVRGECVVLNSDFAKLGGQYSNPRNLASGAISCQDPNETKSKFVTFVGVKVIVHDPSGKIYDTQPLDLLKKWGFIVPKHIEVSLSDKDAITQAIESWLASRSELPYWNDGIVIRIKDDALYNDMGFSGVCPKGACAYKFENERAKTVLRDIVVDTGRLGFITPVAIFDPVELGGATVERCSLHNWEWMKVNGNPSIGAEITIEKCGDIIPGLASVEKAGNGDTKKPKACPSCGFSPLVQVDTQDGYGKRLKCTNGMKCPAQFRDTTLNILRKLEVKGMAETTLDKIIAAGLIKEPWDLFKMGDNELVAAGFGKRESSNIIGSLRGVEGKAVNILAAVGVEMWGRRMFAKLQRLSPAFTDDRLLAGDFPFNEVSKVTQVGPVRAKVLADAFSEKGYGKEFLANLLKWIHPTKPVGDATKKVGGKLAGMSFCLSGSMPRGKKQIEEDIVAAGGTVASGVSKKLSVLVAGEGSGSKSDKARELGVRIVSEDELYTMIGG